MFSLRSTNRKRSQSAVLSSIANVHHQNNNNNNNKRIKLESNQNILSANCKRIAKVAPNASELQSPVSCLSAQSSSSRALHLNHLPFDCLFSIFKRILLQNRITRLCLVCHHWKSTVAQMCTIKGQLTINLFDNYKPRVMQLVTSDLEQYWTNVRHEKMESLLLKNPKRPIPDLSIRFPLVTHLVIRSNDTTERQNRASRQLFLSLLGEQPQKWCSSLTSLTLWKTTKITDPTFLTELCSMINRKFNPSNLTQLYLYIKCFGPQTAACHPEPVKLYNVLRKLERFVANCSFKNWPSVLRTLGDPTSSKSREVKELDLSENRLSLKSLPKLLSLTVFTSTVTHLHLTSIYSREWFSLICESFSLLQFLYINIGYNKFDADWFADLRKLTHLTELKMHHFQLDPTVKTVPLPAIKKLTIFDTGLLTKFRVATGSNRFNASQYCDLLSHHFPSVLVLILVSNEKSVTIAQRNIRKWTQVHFKQINKVVLVLKAEEYRTDMKVRKKFMRQYYKSLRN